MAVSGSRDFILTRSDIITHALRRIGVLGLGDTASATELSEAAEVLNILQLSWQNDGIFLWTQTDDLQLLTADALSYNMDSDILEVKNVFFRKDGSDTLLTPLTREEFKALSDKDSTGNPTSYFMDYQLAQPVLYPWPIYDYTTSVRTGSDSAAWLCIKDHTSASASYPVTGADYATYWASTAETTGGAWATATAYYSGIIRFTKVYRLQDFDAATDNPDFPVRWYKALILGLAAELCPEWGKLEMSGFDKLVLLADRAKKDAMYGLTESTTLRLQPRLR